MPMLETKYREQPVVSTIPSRQTVTVNEEQKRLLSFIYSAIQHGDSGSLVSILDASALDVNIPDNFGQTLLHIAAFSGQAEICELLIRRGA
jgi:ankyrin repeat protein